MIICGFNHIIAPLYPQFNSRGVKLLLTASGFSPKIERAPMQGAHAKRTTHGLPFVTVFTDPLLLRP